MAVAEPKPTNPPPAAPEKVGPQLPPLEHGDRLTRAEFERRYEAMPRVKKAELIEGVVYMPSPVTHGRHGRPHFVVNAWLGQYYLATPGVDGGDNSSLRLDMDNEPQPDAFLRLEGGQSHLDEEGYLVGGPELVAEVAASSASYDLHDKLNAYRRNGVREYVVWRVLDQALDWFVFREGRYEPLAPGEDGIYRSEVFPGLWLDPIALINGDRARVSQVLQNGLASPEYSQFAARLTGALAGEANQQ
jgi:Uma2 family endonuclease